MSQRQWIWEEDGYTVFRGSARTAPGCHDHCGVLMYVKDGKLQKVEGDPENPFNQGRLCARCLATKDVVYSNQRLLHPLKRTGARGENKWQQITWDEAYDTIETKLNDIKAKYGAESVIFTQGTGRDNMGPSGRLAYAFGSPNWTIGFLSGNACYMPRMATMAVIAGDCIVVDCSQYWEDRYDNPNYVMPETIIVWGHNPVVANADGFFGHWVVDLMKKGTKLIVVDPRMTWLAGKAHLWLQIRPGTDGALALAMLNIIINEDLYDHDFVENWTYGFEELRERVQQYPVEKVAEITWLDAEKIRQAARLYAKSKPAAIQWGLAIDQTKEGVAAAHAIISLFSITGNLDVPGGNVIVNNPFGIIEPQWCGGWGHNELLSEEQQAKRIGLQRYPLLGHGLLCTSPDEVTRQIETGEPYPIKAAFMQANNAIACMGADAHRVHEALKKLDFIVVADLFMTPTALAVADIVLPVSTWPERIGFGGYAGVCLASITKGIEPAGETKSDWLMMIELGHRFNPEGVPWSTEEEMYDDILGAAGLSYNDLKENGWIYPPYSYKKYMENGFRTNTGLVELKSSLFDSWGINPLPFYAEPPESPVSTPELMEEYPFVLTTGARKWSFFHSEHRQIKALRSLYPDPRVEINPETAKALGIDDGDWVWIENSHGKCKQKAMYVETIHPQVVHGDHAWWFPERDPNDGTLFGVFESNINNLIPMGECGQTGFGAPYKTSICKVYKVEGGCK